VLDLLFPLLHVCRARSSSRTLVRDLMERDLLHRWRQGARCGMTFDIRYGRRKLCGACHAKRGLRSRQRLLVMTRIKRFDIGFKPGDLSTQAPGAPMGSSARRPLLADAT